MKKDQKRNQIKRKKKIWKKIEVKLRKQEKEVDAQIPTELN